MLQVVVIILNLLFRKNHILKNKVSLISLVFVCIVLLAYRVNYSDLKGGPPLKITFWDANGYYLYLPSIIHYHDYKQLKWLDTIDARYHVTGGNGFQAQKVENGNYVFKYLGGVALMELPFYYAGEFAANLLHYPVDGFSPPYQYSLGFGILFYNFIALWLLRRILLLFFSDINVAITLILTTLATNYIQYVSIDNGQSHAYLFLVYTLVLYLTIIWHQKPKTLISVLLGYFMGLAMICRPTEAVIILIPILWNTQNKENAGKKWGLVGKNRIQVLIMAASGFLGVLPQLIYWKMATGSLVYDVGSKWEFLSPHFQVLIGWEKGWFIYTPATILFIAGFLFSKRFDFFKSAAWFCFLNIYIIIAWHDWRYGGSYSTRALVQSYPVLALPLAALVDEAIKRRFWVGVLCFAGLYLTAVNCFQITQYCNSIILFDGMNRLYYGRIYLNPHPSEKDMAFLDNDEVVDDESRYSATKIYHSDSGRALHFGAGEKYCLAEADISSGDSKKDTYYKFECTLRSDCCLWPSFLGADFVADTVVKSGKDRLYSPISVSGAYNYYVFYLKKPENLERGKVRLYVTSSNTFDGQVSSFAVTKLVNKEGLK